MWGQDAVNAKREFVELALKAAGRKSNLRELCRRFRVSPTTAYRLIRRYMAEGEGAFQKRSRRPKRSPTKTSREVEAVVLALRDRTHWGGRKIAHVLRRDYGADMPPRSTVNKILKRNGRISEAASEAARPFRRFEHAEPNELLQMDFMGYFATAEGPCHSLTVLDDHSRFSLCLQACGNQKTETVQRHLTEMFERYGLPYRMTMDNGSPWGDSGGRELTKLTVWLVRLGVRVSHSRPFHPQTQGKDERFHLTLRREVTNHITFRSLREVQRAFDSFRDRYNLVRPHEALGMAVPAARYVISSRAMPASLPIIEYPPGDAVRKVSASAAIHFKGRLVRVGKACIGLPVAVRPTRVDGRYDVYFCHHKIKEIDLRTPSAHR